MKKKLAKNKKCDRLKVERKKKKNENKNQNQIRPQRNNSPLGRNFQSLPRIRKTDGKNHRQNGRNRNS
jgi:hypothetical protein